MIELNGAVALVTGAGSGIGLAVCNALQGRGMKVVGSDIDSGRLDAFGDGAGASLAWPLDVGDAEAVAALPDALPEAWRAVEVLVNCAGHDIGGRQPFANGDADLYAGIIETNLIGTIRVTHAVARAMLERKRGHIVNIGSSAGHRTEQNTATYTASKHAIHGFSDTLRKDFAGTGVRVTEICPGRVRTNFGYARANTKAEADAHYDAVGQCLTPDDIAAGIIYALDQPPHVVVAQLHIMPADQL
jgi:3-hydroxy acid dehydrogenase / malonic semialdehyde reductase